MTRVAVTTSADRWDRPAAELARVGLEPVPLPCIAIAEVPGAAARARAAAGEADLVVVTSARVVEVVWPTDSLPELDYAAVGGSTAAAVAQRGGRVITAGTGGAVALAHQLVDDVEQRRVLYLHAHGSDPGAIALLAARAAFLSSIAVYRSAPIGPKGEQVDAATFASPSAVVGWLRTRTLDDLVVAAIGATTAGELERQGRNPDVLAPIPSFAALAEALARYLEEAA